MTNSEITAVNNQQPEHTPRLPRSHGADARGPTRGRVHSRSTRLGTTSAGAGASLALMVLTVLRRLSSCWAGCGCACSSIRPPSLLLLLAASPLLGLATAGAAGLL